MTMQKRAVLVKQLPQNLRGKPGRLFFQELERSMQADRPSIVLDCSSLQRLDRPAVDLLLCCLEEAIKRNGDVRLAAVPSGADAILELTGVNRLFDIFDTAEAAIGSFHQPSRAVPAETHMPGVVAARAAKSSAAGLRWSFMHAQRIGGFEEN